MTREVNRDGTTTYYKGLGFCAGGHTSNMTEVDVKDGKIVRIRNPKFDRRVASHMTVHTRHIIRFSIFFTRNAFIPRIAFYIP